MTEPGLLAMLDNAPQQRWHTSAEEMCCLMADTRTVTAPSSAAVTWFSGSVRLLVGSADMNYPYWW